MADSTVSSAVRATLDAVASGDRGALRRALGRDYFSYRPGPGEATAAEVVGGLVDDVFAAFPDMTLRLVGLSEDGGVASLQLAVSGTNTGGIWGAPPTGRALAMDIDVRVRRVEGGYAFTIDGMVGPAILGLLREVELVNPADQMHLPPRHRGTRLPELLLRMAWNGQVAEKACDHFDQVLTTEPTRVRCDDCGPDDIYPTVRLCVTCGHLGCCDTSLAKHARAHYVATGHPLMRSLHEQERWMWCYEDGVLLGGATTDRLAAQIAAGNQA
jgi:hypothetical protein